MTMHDQSYPCLLAFSLGQRDAQATMDMLAIDNVEDLFLLMAQAQMPMPRLADAAKDEMVEAMHALPALPTT